MKCLILVLASFCAVFKVCDSVIGKVYQEKCVHAPYFPPYWDGKSPFCKVLPMYENEDWNENRNLPKMFPRGANPKPNPDVLGPNGMDENWDGEENTPPFPLNLDDKGFGQTGGDEGNNRYPGMNNEIDSSPQKPESGGRHHHRHHHRHHRSGSPRRHRRRTPISDNCKSYFDRERKPGRLDEYE